MITNVLFFLAIVIIIVLIYQISSLKMHIKFTDAENIKLSELAEELNIEKINNIKEIQDLKSKIEYLNKVNLDLDQARKEAFDSAKASLFDLGSGLSKQLIELHKQENQESRQESEKQISATSEKFHKEFEKLLLMVSSLSKEVDQSKSTVDVIKKSLLSPSGAGKLAEITLENILKTSGLKQNIDFMMQHNLSNEDGRQRPDALIFLPSDNLMVVDAKASKFLVEIAAAEKQEEKDILLKSLMKTMNAHLKSLVSKEYAENTISHYHLKSKHFNNVITLMFLPTESALEQITALDPHFIQKAWEQNIFPVGPTGIMNMLSFAKFQINDFMRTENHKLIIEEIRRLLGSVSVLSDYSQKLGSNIRSLAANYDKFSASFNRNFLPKARSIQSLGVDLGKATFTPLERYHIVSTQSELLDVEEAPLISLEEKKEK